VEWDLGKKEAEVRRLNMAREFPRRIHVPVESTGKISESEKSKRQAENTGIKGNERETERL
jgi:hypothetical protein